MINSFPEAFLAGDLFDGVIMKFLSAEGNGILSLSFSDVMTSKTQVGYSNIALDRSYSQK